MSRFLRPLFQLLLLPFLFLLPLCVQQLVGAWPGALVVFSPGQFVAPEIAIIVVVLSTVALAIGLATRASVALLAVFAVPLVATLGRVLLLPAFHSLFASQR